MSWHECLAARDCPQTVVRHVSCCRIDGSVHTKLASPILGCFVVASLACLPGTAAASVVTFEYTEVFTGDTPSGDRPWLRATFSDGPEADKVRLRLEAGGLSRGEFVSKWLFNLDPALDPDDLSIARVAGLSPSQVRADENDFNHGGARFDLSISFPDRHRDRFDADDFSELLISWRPGAPSLPLTPESFAFLTPGSRGRFRSIVHAPTLYTTAHIQGIVCCDDDGDDDDSSWVSADPALRPPDEPVPEPGTLLLVGSGVLGLAGLRRRRGRCRSTTAARSRTS